MANLGINAVEVTKSVYDHVIYDSNTVERPFAVALDDPEVKLFFKIPDRFKIAPPPSAPTIPTGQSFWSGMVILQRYFYGNHFRKSSMSIGLDNKSGAGGKERRSPQLVIHASVVEVSNSSIWYWKPRAVTVCLTCGSKRA